MLSIFAILFIIEQRKQTLNSNDPASEATVAADSATHVHVGNKVRNDTLSSALRAYHKWDSGLLNKESDIVVLNGEIEKLKQASNSINSIEAAFKTNSNLSEHFSAIQQIIKKGVDSLTLVKNDFQQILAGERSCIEKILGMEGHFSIKFKFRNTTYRLFAYDLADSLYSTEFNLKDNKGFQYRTIENLYGALSSTKERQVLMITNGGMYKSDNMPQGLFVENFKQISKLDLSQVDKQVNFYMLPNGVFYIDSNNQPGILKTISFEEEYKTRAIKLATQSGPMLVIDGQIHSKFMPGSSNRLLRSGVGIPFNYSTKLVFIISDGDVNFYDFASLFSHVFGCKNALYLDGVISKMYLPEVSPYIPEGNFGPMISVSKKIVAGE
jgi:uncharacterized protein YigE (DUF2233 family)